MPHHHRFSRAGTVALLVVLAAPFVVLAAPAPVEEAALEAADLARRVTIFRDAYGVPHVDGETDASAVFGFAYAQAEDNFWQVEDAYAAVLGRYSEIHGETELKRDLRNRLFRIAETARADFASGSVEGRQVAAAFAAGLNYYLDTHPEVRPRVVQRFEPWHVLAYARGMALELTFGSMHVPGKAWRQGAIWSRRGSNAWAISGKRTRSGQPLLLINPHQPWYGFGRFYEVHLRSRAGGWNFTGATFPGSALPSLGHNEHAGWAFTVNEPDVGDVWRVTFDDPENPLRYRYGAGYRLAEEWSDTIRVWTPSGVEERRYTFRRTHHGPVVGKESETVFLVARNATLEHGFGAEQALALLRTRNLDDFKRALALLQFPIFNVVYADRHGDIFYCYNGVVPRRSADFDWTRPVDGSNPDTEWRGLHPFEELPQIENPRSGYLQSCNSTPFRTTDDDNPSRGDYPPYMIEDRDDDKRRSRLSRMILRDLRDATLEDFERLAYDTRLYWPLVELPRLARAFRGLETRDPELAGRVKPYLDHLLEWDCRVTESSTAATLCVAWYAELYGSGYPAETLKQQYIDKPDRRFEALAAAVKKLEGFHSTWKVPYGEVNRIQRHPRVVDFFKIPFSDAKPSLPCIGAPGPLGIIFTVYFTPSVRIPFLRNLEKRYAIVGTSYMSVVELGERVRGRSVLHYGQSGDPDSPHFFDQATLMSERRLKPQHLYWDDVRKHAVSSYRPGDRPAAK